LTECGKKDPPIRVLTPERENEADIGVPLGRRIDFTGDEGVHLTTKDYSVTSVAKQENDDSDFNLGEEGGPRACAVEPNLLNLKNIQLQVAEK